MKILINMDHSKEYLKVLQESINWVSKEIKILKKSQPLDHKGALHKKNLENKLIWELKQLPQMP